MKYYVMCVIIGSMTVSCSFSSIRQNQLRKGMSHNVVRLVLGQDAAVSSKIDVPSDAINRYAVDVYTSNDDGIFKRHVFAYRNDSLLYWGMPHELLRHPSQILNEIGAAAATLQ